MTQQYFQKGFVTFRDLQNALLGVGGGGLESWDPITEPTKIQAGIFTAPGSFILLEDYNGSPIDDISSGSRGDIIYFFQNTGRWAVISAEDKNKGVYQTLLQLQTAYPTAQNGDYALVVATGTFYAWYNNQWNNTGSNVAPDALRSTNNLSDLTDDAVARTNLDVYSKSETNTQINNGVFSNVNIATNANIETSKIKQTTINPNTGTPANNDTQDILNNKFAGNISEVKTKIDNLPVGASSGDTLFLTNTDSAIIGYKTLSKQPSTATQQAITTTANNNEVLASSFVNPIQIGLTKLNGGIWQVNIFAYADHSGSCRVIAKFYNRAVDNSETLLFTATSPLILSTDPNNPDVLSIESPQQDFTVATTDLLVVKIFVSTTRTQNTNITYYHSGSTFFSHIHTPLVPNHNDLKGIQGGVGGEYNHLSNSQVTLVNDVVNRIPKVPTATVNNFAIFDANGNIVDSLKNASSFEPADATILKQANVINNLTSTSTNLPLSANQGKVLQDNKLNIADAPATAITAVGGVLTDTNSIDFVYTASPQKIEANVKTANTTKINITTGASGISADINAGTLTNADINNTANIATSKIQNGSLVSNTSDIANNDLLSTIVNKTASLLPIFNNTAGKYLSTNKTWSDLNQNAVGISSDVRRDSSDNIVFSDQATTDSGTQGNLTVRLGNTTTSSTKGGDLILQASNGTAGSGNIVMQVAPLPNVNIEVGTSTNYANANIQNASFSHTVPADKSNRLLVVSFATAVSAPATAVTYGGVAMTEISSGPVASTSVNVQTFYLVNPTSGTANVVITRGNTGSIVANAVNIANVNQSTPISGEIEGFNNNQTTSASLNVSTGAGQVVIGVIGTINTAANVGAGQVSIFSASSGNQERGASSYELATTTTTTISYTFTNSSFAMHAFAINQIGSGSLGQMQEVLRVNSQGTYSNNVKRTSIYQAGQTLALTEDLPQTLIFTSSVVSNSTIKLPDATRMLVGTAYEFINYNSFTLTVNNYGGSQLGQVIGTNQKSVFILTDNSTTNGTWVVDVYLPRGAISNDELSYLDGVTSAIQTQFNNKQGLNANLTQLSGLSTTGNKYKVIRLNSSETGVAYDLALQSLTTAERDALTSPATDLIIYNETLDKFQKYDGTAWLSIVSAGTGNVSVNSLSGITTGELALFSSGDGTTLTKIDGTSSQRRVLSRNSKLVANFTTTERNAIGNWQSGDVIFNNTLSRLENYDGTSFVPTHGLQFIQNGSLSGSVLNLDNIFSSNFTSYQIIVTYKITGAGAANGHVTYRFKSGATVDSTANYQVKGSYNGPFVGNWNEVNQTSFNTGFNYTFTNPYASAVITIVNPSINDIKLFNKTGFYAFTSTALYASTMNNLYSNSAVSFDGLQIGLSGQGSFSSFNYQVFGYQQ